MNERTSGYESVTRLSVYIGEFHPDAQMKGLSGCNLIALTFYDQKREQADGESEQVILPEKFS